MSEETSLPLPGSSAMLLATSGSTPYGLIGPYRSIVSHGQGRTDLLGSGERMADDRRLSQPDQAALTQRGNRAAGVQVDCGERRGQKADRPMGEGLGRGL